MLERIGGELDTSGAAGAAELGSCPTDATPEGRSQRAIRNVPLCWRPNVNASSYRGGVTRWCHANLRVELNGMDCRTESRNCQGEAQVRCRRTS